MYSALYLVVGIRFILLEVYRILQLVAGKGSCHITSFQHNLLFFVAGLIFLSQDRHILVLMYTLFIWVFFHFTVKMVCVHNVFSTQSIKKFPSFRTCVCIIWTMDSGFACLYLFFFMNKVFTKQVTNIIMLKQTNCRIRTPFFFYYS